jgi:hypothetical protein
MAAQDYIDITEILDYLHDRIDNNKTALGLKHISYGDEQLLPEYPALVLTAERPTQTRQHATRQWYRSFFCDLWLFHAKLSVSRRVRTREDIELARKLEKFLNADRTLGDHIIFGFVTDLQPIVIGRITSTKGNAVIATRLSWQGENRVLWSVEEQWES